MKIIKDTSESLITYSLGSCLGLTVYDSQNKIGGLVHCLLPNAKIDEEKAAKNPYMFVETGVTALFNQMFKLGASRKNLIVKAAGCGAALNTTSQFNIGERNFTILRKILWKNNILLNGKDVGGSKPRTMILEMETGETTIKVGAERYKI
ncbi:MAG: chemotaxis protein CheD [Candidatus Muiribacteriota bacterium]